MGRIKILRWSVIFFLLFFIPTSLFAVEEYVSEVYKEIDSAFSNKSDEELNIILQANQGDKYYFLMENYATKKIRRLIITNDYEFAMDTIIVLIDNNLDNTDAVEMYASIADAYEAQQKQKREEQEKLIKEEERIVKLKEGQRASAEKEYDTVKNAEGKTVFVTGKDGKLTYSGWDFNIGINPAILLNSSDNLLSILAGVSLYGQYYKRIDDYTFGGDLFGNFQFLNLPFSGKDKAMYGQFEIFPKVAFVNFTDKFFVKVGFIGVLPMKPDNNIADTLDVFLTPALGVNIENLKFERITFSAGADYLLGHLWTPDLNFAAGLRANLKFNVVETYIVKFNFNLGVKDIIYIKNSGVENRLNIFLALGVENVTE